MQLRPRVVAAAAIVSVLLSSGRAHAQTQSGDSRWVIDLGFGINPTINGNINSGAIGTLQGQTAAILPHSYGDVYGNGIDFRFGGGYVLDSMSELRGMFIWQTADADLVRLGDYGASSLYGQYDDYKAFGFDFGYRRYMPNFVSGLRVYAEASIGIADVNRINIQLAAPQSNLVKSANDFYDGTAAFAWSLGGGVLFPIASHLYVNAQLGFRHVGGLADVDQFAGTGLDTINNHSARLTVPFVVGVRIHLK